MSKWPQFIIGVIAAGAIQFGTLAAAAALTGAINQLGWLVIAAGVIGTMGTTAVGLLKQLPRDEWPTEKREKEPA